MAMRGRPTWQGHLKLSLVTCPVALYTGVRRAGDVHFNMLSAKTHNRIRMIPTDPGDRPDRPGRHRQGLRDRQGPLRHRHQRGDRCGAAGEHPHDRDRALRRCRRHRPHVLERALLHGPRRQAGAGGLCGDPRGDEAHRPHRDRPRRHAHPRAAGGDRAARRGPAGLHAAHQGRGARSGRGVRRHPEDQGRQRHGRHRREDHRPAVGPVRPLQVQRPLRRGAQEAHRRRSRRARAASPRSRSPRTPRWST